MTHPLVDQLRFTRSEFRRALRGLKDDEARRRFLPMNCISWNIGHLAWQELRYFLYYGQGQMLLPGIDKSFASGAPACTPELDEMWAAWKTITTAACPDVLCGEALSGRGLQSTTGEELSSAFHFGILRNPR